MWTWPCSSPSAVASSLINEVTTAHVSLGGCAIRQNVGPWGMPGTRGSAAHSRFHLHKRSSGGTVGEGGGCSPDWPHPASQTPALSLRSLFGRPPKEAREGPITGAQTWYSQVQTSLISVMGRRLFSFYFLLFWLFELCFHGRFFMGCLKLQSPSFKILSVSLSLLCSGQPGTGPPNLTAARAATIRPSVLAPDAAPAHFSPRLGASAQLSPPGTFLILHVAPWRGSR